MSQTTTRSAAVFEALRRDIFSGALQPGARLRFVELSERFSVSQSVVREALTRLAGQGLAVLAPQQGFRVVELSLTDLDELTEARCDIEALAFRRAVERGSLEWESAALAAHHTLAATPADSAGEPDDAWFDAHESFHHALLAGCGNARLLGIAQSLRDAAAVYRHWSRPLGHDYDRDVAAEHRGLIDAAVARDADEAQRLLIEHIERTTAALRPAAEAG